MPEWLPRPPLMTPYAHWFSDKEAPYLNTGLEASPLIYRPRSRGTRMALIAAIEDHNDNMTPDFSKTVSKAYFGGGLVVPLPKGAHSNESKMPEVAVDEVALLRQRVRPVPKDAVITGIIDSGIALGNARFRDVQTKDGALQSRVIASWQQSGVWAHGLSNITFGQEVFQRDIEDMFAQHQTAGWLDEDAFNRAIGLSDPHRPMAQRDLEFSAAHGTHVADLAAGFDVEGTPADMLSRRPIIAVNLPDRFSHGSAGNFLEYFAVYAIERIVDLADLIWDAQHGAGTGGFPIVINMSYGLQAGPKDASMIFESFCSDIIARRVNEGKPALRIILPAGNDNLMRCHARSLMGKPEPDQLQSERFDLSWRMVPADQTPNFVEIHATSAYEALCETDHKTAIALTITPPGRPGVTLRGEPGRFIDLWGFARLYCDATPDPGNPARHRIRLVLCALPTSNVLDDAKAAPAGLWALSLAYGGAATDVSVYVQSDQALVAGSANAKRSYFEHPAYTGFDHMGGAADTYSYPEGGHLEDWRNHGPIQRKGTLNAIASNTEASVIGGFRLKDGAPAAYSATARGVALSGDAAHGRTAISALFPADDGCMHQGLLASGVRSGSAAFIQGTSMSTALATRFVVDALLQDPDSGTEKWLTKAASDFEASLALPTNQNWPALRAFTNLKTGAGRLRADMPRRVQRIGGG